MKNTANFFNEMKNNISMQKEKAFLQACTTSPSHPGLSLSLIYSYFPLQITNINNAAPHQAKIYKQLISIFN